VSGSFRLVTKILHLHKNFKFVELILETVKQSLHHSCRTSIKCQRILLPLDRQNTAAVYWDLFKRWKNCFFWSCSTGQVSVFIHIFTNWQKPVFLLNSRCFRLCINFKRLPQVKVTFYLKLQSQFAEFLQYYFFKHLNFLN